MKPLNKRDEALVRWFNIQDMMEIIRENQFSIPHHILNDLLKNWEKELNYFIEQEIKDSIIKIQTQSDHET